MPTADFQVDELLDQQDRPRVCIRAGVVAANEGLPSSWPIAGARPAQAGLAVLDAQTQLFQRRLLPKVQAAPEYDGLTPTERRVVDAALRRSREGGEMFFRHDDLAAELGLCRRTILRALKRAVSLGLLTSSPSGWRGSRRYINIYRIARRFMSALKAAGKLIARGLSQLKKAFSIAIERARANHLSLAEILSQFKNVRRCGRGYVASCPCPGHGAGRGDRNPSLSLADENGRLLWHCFAWHTRPGDAEQADPRTGRGSA